jgi:hypothetical protein
MQWFRHDIGAFKDERIQALRIDCGGGAVDVYYAILELIYEGETDLVMRKNQAETKSVLHWLCVGWAGFREYVDAMAEAGLLSVSVADEGERSEALTISSERAAAFIGDYHAKAETARQNGRKGGRPKKGNQEKTQSVSDRNPGETQSKANKEIRNKNIEKEVSNDTSKKKRAKFSKPTVEELAAYAAERGATSFDAQRFYDWYESNGWKVGRNPMKDWKAAVRNWIARDSKRNNPKTYEEVANERYGEYSREAVRMVWEPAQGD